jgi:hypothetical protein
MNTIDFKVTVGKSGQSGRKRWLDPGIFIDGQPFCASYPIDLDELYDSMKEDGEFHIFTCSCGDPGCNRLDDGIQVSTGNDCVSWKVFDYYFVGDIGERWRLSGEDDKPAHVYTFDRAQYVERLTKFFEEAKAICRKFPTIGISPHGYSPKLLLRVAEGSETRLQWRHDHAVRTGQPTV